MKSLLIIIFALISHAVLSQVVPQLSQKNFDIMQFNPAIVGSKLNHEIQIHHRSQWVGFDGAPTTSIFSYNGSYSKRVGIGVSIFNDNTKTVKSNAGGVYYAYHLVFERFNISLGASAYATGYKINLSELEFVDQSDSRIYSNDIRNEISPNATAGIYIYNNKFNFGLSMTEMFRGISDDVLSDDLLSYQNYYAIGGYSFNITDFINLTPNIISTYGKSNPLQITYGLQATLYNNFMLAVNYRHKDAFVFTTGIKLLKNIFFAYSYDYDLSDLNGYNNGSHEVVLSAVISRKPAIKTDAYNNKYRKNKRSYW